MVGGRGDVHIIRVYLPPATNTLLSVAGHCLRSRQYVNVIVAGKQPALTYLTVDEAILHCTHGLGIWPWASNTDGEPDVVLACASNTDGEPDVVLACAGDVPTLETLAAELLRTHLPPVKVRVVNVVDLMRLGPPSSHPHLGPARHRLSVGGGPDAHAASCLLRTARLGDEDFPGGGQHEYGAWVPARRLDPATGT
jgi:phosphoketolase